jgi:RNA polymerase sigma-B factor
VRERTARALARAEVTSERRRQELLDYVVSINLDVARALVSTYVDHGHRAEDLLRVAEAALARAARDFDPRRHQDFLAFALPTVQGELKRHARGRGWSVDPPQAI